MPYRLSPRLASKRQLYVNPKPKMSISGEFSNQSVRYRLHDLNFFINARRIEFYRGLKTCKKCEHQEETPRYSTSRERVEYSAITSSANGFASFLLLFAFFILVLFILRVYRQ